MKYSTITTLCTAPLALAGSFLKADMVEQAAPLEARDGHLGGGGSAIIEESQSGGGGGGGVVVSSAQVIVIWVNNGGGAATQTMNAEEAPPPSAATHEVMVGGAAGLVYTPDTINAAVGDMVIFSFGSENHTVTQSTFDEPCKKMAAAEGASVEGASVEGAMASMAMDSGFMPNPKDSPVDPPPQMAMKVTTDKPLWFYCKQKTPTPHCGKGMTFSLNPTAEKTQAMFKALAISQAGLGQAPPIAGGAPSGATPPAAAGTGSAGSGGGLTAGSGDTGSGGNCACSCLCGVASFPNAGVQGLGAFGGMSGAMPMSALEQ